MALRLDETLASQLSDHLQHDHPFEPVGALRVPQADALVVQTCVPAEPSFLALVDHVHLELTSAGRAIAAVVLKPRELDLMRRTGLVSFPMSGAGQVRTTFVLRPPIDCRADVMEAVPQATGVVVYACQAGNFHIELTGADERALARATFDADQFTKFIGDGCDLIELVSRGGLYLQLAEGNA